MQSPFFSIIIPTYNSAISLGFTIESILGQTYTNYEILIIDGGSNDGTVEVANRFSKGFIKIISERDLGIYDAMNKGITMAKGEWLYFLGSDDQLFDNDVLQKVFQVTQSGTNKLIYGNVKVVGDTGWAKNETIYDGEFTLEKLLLRNICHQAIFYHKSVFKEVGNYNIHYTICADYDFNIKCFSNYQFTYLPKIIAYFNGGGFSTSKRDKVFGKEQWINIVTYFRFRLFENSFELHKANLLSVAKTMLHRRKYYLFILAWSAYLYHRIFSRK